jgi:hypothetical protein
LLISGTRKRTALQRLDAEGFEEIEGRDLALQMLRLEGSGQVERFIFVRSEVVEEMALFAPIREVWIRRFAVGITGL